jgi:hypothetical protein
VRAYLEDIQVEVAGQFRRADLREDAEGQRHDIVVVSVEIYPDAVGGHHQQLRLLVEELGESWVRGVVPR